MIEKLESMLSFASRGFWRASWQASILALVVLLLQMVLGTRLGARGRYALWAIVLLRLLLPALPGSKFSAYTLLQTSEPAPLAASRVQPVIATAKPQATEAASLPAPRAVELSSPQSPAPRFTASQILGSIWICGAIILLLRVAVSCAKLRSVMNRLSSPSDQRIVQLADSCAKALGLRRVPSIYIGDSVRTPAVVGLLRPRLILPTQIIKQCSCDEIRLILLHELAHLKRHDLAANWLIALATVIHWFNPIVWLAAARMRSDRELACDELVLTSTSPADARAYGLTLVKLIEILSPRPPSTQLVGILESTAPMQRRVRMIAQFHPHGSRRWILTTGLLLLLGCAALTDSAHGDPKAVKSAAPATSPSAAVQHEQMVEVSPQSNAELQAELARVLPEVKFDNIPMGDAMDFLREQGGLNLIVQWRALEAAGLDRNAPVTLWLKRVTVEQVLDHILNDVGGGTIRLDHSFVRGAVVVSTEEDLSREVTTVFYDVNDLLVSPEGQTLTGQDAQKKIEELKKVITGTISPETWRDAGGTVGAVDIFNTKLIITTTPKFQHQIDLMLARLREKPTTQPRPLTP